MQRAPAPSAGQGLPADLRGGVESLSGMDMSGVRVHYASPLPAQLNALAYAQGTDIHLARGQEKHLPHEAWHVVQQMQGRVRPTMQLAGTQVNDDGGLEREADVMGARSMTAATRAVGPLAQASPAAGAAQCKFGDVAQLSIMSRWRWGDYFRGLPNNQRICDAIDTGELRTTIEDVTNAHGRVTNWIIRLHAYANNAWGAIGSVTIDRSQVQAPVQGPLLPGAAPLAPMYDNRVLTLHTAAPAGGNAGVATYLFPAVLGWIDRNLRGVQEINMNPAGGAASKSVMAELGQRLGDPAGHLNAVASRNARKNAETQARLAAAQGGPAVVGIGSGAGVNALNTWDTRLNDEHMDDLISLDQTPYTGLDIQADGMTLAGTVDPNDINNMQLTRDYFANRMNGPIADPIVNALHPAAHYFQAAAALTNGAIAAAPRAAAQTLRMARLTSRSGALGIGGALDAGYQIRMSGNALARVLPHAIQ
ncbi:DUF4157 domain-containing protein [Dyella subtropica]|uniref:eCIS core domain-containing protein n=1 Tax=Dyella subtropica TaxID=2992127 RepID=UPI002253DA29|nr:DUF4157 domain-containing protein [Dyella subtropica]